MWLNFLYVIGMLIKTEYSKIQPYATKDGSIIRELMHPNVHENTGTVPLKILCCCAPPYSHDDTELLNP